MSLTGHRSPTSPPHAGRGRLPQLTTHGRTTKKNSGSSTPIATDPIYMPFFQSLHRSRPPTALEKKDRLERASSTERHSARSRNLASVPHARREALYRTLRARRRRPGRIQFWARCNRRRLRHKAQYSSSARSGPSVRDSRRLCAAACVSWVPAARQRTPTERSTTRTASFIENGTRERYF